MAKVATLWAEGGWIHIRSPYNAEYVSAIKLEIDRSYRKWNPDSKTWSVDVSMLDILISISERFFTVNVIEQQPAQIMVAGDAYSELLKSLPDKVLKKVYLLIVSECHPDKGVDGKLLSGINAAWNEVKKLRGL